MNFFLYLYQVNYYSQLNKQKIMAIFTTGAFIVPMTIDGKQIWVVSSFEDSTFENGKEIDIKEDSHDYTNHEE